MPTLLARLGRTQVRLRLVISLPLLVLLINTAALVPAYLKVRNDSQQRALNYHLLQARLITTTAEPTQPRGDDAYLADLAEQVVRHGRMQADIGVVFVILRSPPAGSPRFLDSWGSITPRDETELYTLAMDPVTPRVIRLGPRQQVYLVSTHPGGRPGIHLIALEPYERILELADWLLLIGIAASLAGALAMLAAAWVITAPLHRLAERTRELARQELGDREQLRAVLEGARNPEEVSALVLAFEQALEGIVNLKRSIHGIIESMEGGILSADVEGRLLYANSAARELLGLEGSLTGRPVRSLVPAPDQNRALLRVLDDLVDRRLPHARPREIALLNGRGEQLQIGVATSLVTGEHGGVLNYLIVMVDLTELSHLQSRLRQADRLSALGSMATKVAHEIRNPLGSIKGLAQLALEGAADPEHGVKGYVERIVREVDRLSTIVEELLDYAQRRPLSLEWVDLNELVKEAVDVARFRLGARGPTLLQEFDFTIPRIRLDRNRFLQAALNLLINALQAVDPDGGVVSVSTYREDTTRGSRVVVEVSDNGPGIPPDVLEHIFDPFYTTREEGAGLGLSIAHTIIQEHESMLDVESKVGQGATFRIHIPGERWEGGAVS